MTIKKTVKVARPSVAAEHAESSAAGTAIADRLRLDAPDPAAKPSGGSKVATAAFYVALAALGVAGVLTYMLWKHLEFLMPA